MTDAELDLSYRIGRHPKWVWAPGMLGVKISPDSLYLSDLVLCRYDGEEDFTEYSPYLSDAWTIYLIWESIKKFKLDNYSLVRVFENPIWKCGFSRGGSPVILLFSSSREGNVASRSWMWFAGRKEEK